MSDPEILDPEGPATAGTQTTSGIERLVTEVQRALPGRTVRVDVESRAPHPPRFRLEAEGEGGAIVVESGPFFTANVSFRSARFGFSLAPGAANTEETFAAIAARVKDFADEDLVVFEEGSAPPLLRTVVLGVGNGRIDNVVDSGIAPGNAADARLWSFRGTWNRAPTKQEKARIDKLTGGLVGKMKRKLLAKIVSKTAGSILGAVEQAAENARADAAQPDDGSRKLKG